MIDGNLKLDLETREQEGSVKCHQGVERALEVKERQSILKIIENVLRQMDLHNQTVKHFLAKGISCCVPGTGLVVVFFASERGDLLRHTFSTGLDFTALIFYACC